MYEKLSWVVRPTNRAKWEIYFGVPENGDILCSSSEEAAEERNRCNRWTKMLARVLRRYLSNSVPSATAD